MLFSCLIDEYTPKTKHLTSSFVSLTEERFSERQMKTAWYKISCCHRVLSGSLSKSGPLDFGTKNNFPSFFVSEKGLVHIYKKAIYYFPVSYFCFATSQN